MIEHTVLLKDADLTSGESNPNDFRTALNAISSAYVWNSKSVNIGNNLKNTYGDYYFTDTSHIKIDYFANSQSYLGINQSRLMKQNVLTSREVDIVQYPLEKLIEVFVFVLIRVQMTQKTHTFIIFILVKLQLLMVLLQKVVFTLLMMVH